jgi:hypothetical protein
MSFRDAAARTWYKLFSWLVRLAEFLHCLL